MTLLAELTAGIHGYNPNDLPVDTARGIVLRAVNRLETAERVPIRAALGRIAAEPVRSPIDVPLTNNSALDGFALRGSDLNPTGETLLREVGTALAGHPFTGRIAVGECVRIMTGAVLPADADTVVAKERSRVDDGRVAIEPGAQRGQNWRRAGEDLAAGHLAIDRGVRLGPAEIGLAASLGLADIAVARRLRVALFSTGDELRDVGEPIDSGLLYDSNRYTLHALLAGLHCDVEDFGLVSDDATRLGAKLEAAAGRADLVVASGGISVGDADFTGTLMARLGEALAWKLAMRPGRPLVFGRLIREDHPAWLFGLPGNPVAAMISFLQFVRPAILKMQGARELIPPPIYARMLAPLRKKPGRTEFPRGTLTFTPEGATVLPAYRQGSGILSSMSAANGLIELAHERGDVAEGEFVPVQVLSSLV